MEAKILKQNETKEMLKKKLREDWMILAGNNDIISRIEDTVYTPGTEKNKDCKMIGSPHGWLFLCKNNKEIKEWMGNKPHFERIFYVNFPFFDGEQGEAEFTGWNYGYKEMAINDQVEELFT